MTEDREQYSIRAAAHRVRRARWTIYRWMQEGMPYKVVAGRRWIAHDDLLRMLRTKIHNERRGQFAEKVKRPA